MLTLAGYFKFKGGELLSSYSKMGCQYQDVKTKNKCNSQYQLEIEHIQPLALGGSNDIANLRVLCRTHNALMAKRSGLNYCEN
jgi:5-methylcytosine-specific restriction endonuclease McrA